MSSLQIGSSTVFRTIGFENEYGYNPHCKAQSPADDLCSPGGDVE